jgi:hypothetical protein
MRRAMAMMAAGLLAAGLATGPVRAQPAPAPMPPIEAPPERPAGPFAGKCMWEQMPESARSSILAKPTLGEAYEALSTQALAWGMDGVTRAGRACAVGDDQFRSAGRRMAGWAGRRWAEAQLAGRATPERLEQVYGAFSVADRAWMAEALNAQQGMGDARFDRFFGPLGITRADTTAFAAATAYLVSRLGEDADMAAGR